MSLINRLAGLNNEPKIGVHTFWAAMLEVHYGARTLAQLESFFELDVDEQAELNVLVTKYVSLSAAKKLEFVHMLHAVFMLAESNLPGYTTGPALNARIQAFN